MPRRCFSFRNVLRVPPGEAGLRSCVVLLPAWRADYHSEETMLIQETLTDVPPEEVIRRARTFFTTRLTPYVGFIDEESDSHIRFRFEAGSLVVAAGRQAERTWVRGSTSRLHNDLSRFLASLSVPEAVRQNVIGPGTSGAG